MFGTYLEVYFYDLLCEFITELAKISYILDIYCRFLGSGDCVVAPSPSGGVFPSGNSVYSPAIGYVVVSVIDECPGFR